MATYWSYLYPRKMSNSIADVRQRIGNFNINNLAGRSFWLAADEEIFTDVDGLVPATDGQSVYRWNDKSGLSNDCFQIVESKRPTVVANGLNSLNTLRFTGASSQFMLANNFRNFDIETPTLFIVGKRTSGEGCFCGKGDGNLTDARHRKLIIKPFSGGTNFSYWGGTDVMSGCSANATTANFNIYAIRAKRNNLTILNVNGVDTIQTTTIDNTSLNIKQFAVGSGFEHGAEFIDGEIAEIQLFKRILSDLEMTDVINYLSNKWGILIS